jgi:Papain family cysteine protease
MYQSLTKLTGTRGGINRNNAKAKETSQPTPTQPTTQPTQTNQPTPAQSNGLTNKSFSTYLKGNPIFDREYSKLLVDMNSATSPVKITFVPRECDGRQIWKDYFPRNGLLEQGSCGSCYAVAVALVLSVRHNIMTNNNPHIELSASNIVLCNYGTEEYNITKNAYYEGTQYSGGLEQKGAEVVKSEAGCGGGTLINTWEFVFESGLPTSECMPYDLEEYGTDLRKWTPDTNLPTCESIMGVGYQYCHSGVPAKYYSSGGFYYIPATVSPNTNGSERNIRVDIWKFGIVTSGMEIYDSFLDWDGIGIYKHDPKEVARGGHAVAIIGWSEDVVDKNEVKYWIVANSWGPKWGENGFFKIVRGTNECKIEENVVVGFPDMPGLSVYLDYPNLWSEQSLFLRGIWANNSNQGWTSQTLLDYYTRKITDLDTYNIYNETNIPNWEEFIAGDLNSKHYPMSKRITRTGIRNYRLAVIVLSIIIIILVIIILNRTLREIIIKKVEGIRDTVRQRFLR